MTEVLFIPAKVKSKANKPKVLAISKKLPKQIAIAYSIQYQDVAQEIKIILSKKHKITSFIQVLGCSKPKFSKPTQAVLLIGSGRFHAVSLAKETKLPIYILEQNSLHLISEQEIKIAEQKQKATYLKFLNSERIGVLVSTKPGQQNLKRAINIKKKIKNKSSYLFIGDNLNPAEFENFGLDCWVNTACPRMDFDRGVINIGELEK